MTRETRETRVTVRLTIDGVGETKIDAPSAFLGHLLDALARHGRFDLEVTARGEADVDLHHTVEDTGITLGTAFDRALGDRVGIRRAGSFSFPMDEALGQAAVDLDGRGFLRLDLGLSDAALGDLPAGLLEDFLGGFARTARASVHVWAPAGRSDHHRAEAAFKALGRALEQACEVHPRARHSVPSTKEVV